MNSQLAYTDQLEEVYRGPEGKRRVEQIVLRLLTRSLTRVDKVLQVRDGTRFDAIAPTGIDDSLPGPTIVEITHNLKRVSAPRFVPDLLRVSNTINAKSLLLIATHTLNQDRLAALLKDNRIQDLKIVCWGADKIDELIEQFPDAIGGLLPDIGTKAVAAIVQKADADWREIRKKHVSELQQIYLQDRLSLFLGAGASVDCGIPTWKSLITDLALQLVEEQTPHDLPNLDRGMSLDERSEIARALVQSQDGSPLLLGRYLETSLGSSFLSRVHDVLYRTVIDVNVNSLLTAISNLCRPSRQRKGIYAVVTYNYDDLLEEALDADGTKCRSIFGEGVFPEADELPIYHVHGRLPKSLLPDEDPRIVFSEESYLALQMDHYSWTNFEQLKLLRETTCLFIGVSGTDPNMRRLLDIDFRRSKKAKHYIALKRQTAQDLMRDVPTGKVRQTVVEHFLNIHHIFLEHSFVDLGLTVIWFDRYDELPAILNEIRGE